MREHEFGMSEVGAKGRRDGAFLRPAFSALGLQGIEGRLLESPRRLAHVAHVLHLQIEQVSELRPVAMAPSRASSWRRKVSLA